MNQQLKDPLADALYRLDVQGMELAKLRTVNKALGDELRECERRLAEYAALENES